MPQAIKLIDAQGRSCVYVSIMQRWSTAKGICWSGGWLIADNSALHRHRQARRRAADWWGWAFFKCEACGGWFDNARSARCSITRSRAASGTRSSAVEYASDWFIAPRQGRLWPHTGSRGWPGGR